MHSDFRLLLLGVLAATLLSWSQRGGILAAQDWLGEEVYRANCAKCHGMTGRGDGSSVVTLVPPRPKPRDFTSGLFKFRSTPTGSLPTDEDLIRTVKRGVPGTAMPTWEEDLSEEEIAAVVRYIKRFSPRFGAEQPDPPIKIPSPPPVGRELVARGEEVYRRVMCFKCHGETGRGDGTAAPDLVDAWDEPIPPPDFTRGVWKSGGRPVDLYRTVVNGMDGSPMASFAEAIQDENDRWGLVYYLLSLSGKTP